MFTEFWVMNSINIDVNKQLYLTADSVANLVSYSEVSQNELSVSPI